MLGQTSGGGGGWHEAVVLVCLPLAAPIGLSPLLIRTLRGPERVLVVSTEPPDDLSCLTTPGVGRPGDGLLPVPVTRCIQRHTPSPCGGLPTPALTCARRCVRLQDHRRGGGGHGMESPGFRAEDPRGWAFGPPGAAQPPMKSVHLRHKLVTRRADPTHARPAQGHDRGRHVRRT